MLGLTFILLAYILMWEIDIFYQGAAGFYFHP